MKPRRPVITGKVTVNASPDRVYALVSDPGVMVTFAEEAYRVEWLGGADKPVVGARFRGRNRNGWHRWFTTCEIVVAEPDTRFAYHVSTPFRVPISRWQYDIEPDGNGGCTVTESNWIRVPTWFIPFAIMITGVRDRPGANRANIGITLRRLKEHVESGRDRAA